MHENEIFWELITSVDHSVLTPNGQIVGNSFDVGAKVAGALDSDERVIIDFSKGKKLIKEIIDGPQGLDHKLWVHAGQVFDLQAPILRIDGEEFSIDLPRDAVYIYQSPEAGADWSIDQIVEAELVRYRKFLEVKLNELMPGNPVSVSKLFASKTWPQTSYYTSEGYDTVTFRYSHGLPRSTSYGCQNPIHGHLSYVALRIDEMTIREDSPISDAYEMLIAVFASFGTDDDKTIFGGNVDEPNLYFYNRNDAVQSANSKRLDITFDTLNRGRFALTFSTGLPDVGDSEVNDMTRFVGCNDYSTIENLVQLFRDRIEQIAATHKIYGDAHLSVSEGLNKGASVHFKLEATA